MKELYADIILPLSVKGRFTYAVSPELADAIAVGSVVLVPFATNKVYAGTVTDIHDKKPDFKNIKSILGLAQRVPRLNHQQLRLWEWISKYYICSEGEVMKAALPLAFMPDSDKEGNFSERYRAKEEFYVRLREGFDEKSLEMAIDSLKRAPKQTRLLMDYLSLGGYDEKNGAAPVKRSELIGASDINISVLNGLIKKNILECYSEEVSRLKPIAPAVTKEPLSLSRAQLKALNDIKSAFREKEVVLLHGVTSSGKTEIYIHLILEELAKGKQVLYMLPEIALTTQIISRLRDYFGSAVGIYHSRFNDLEKVEIWEKTKGVGNEERYGLVLGVRSSLFLPFENLGLIIIDEEHDGSYKQQDPAPRYNARDTAIILASLHKAKTVLGSASPSLESYANAVNGKYGLVELNERFGDVRLPDIILADTREAYRKKLMVSHFTPELLSAIDEALGKGEQIILFQNRRGFSPYVECAECGWIPRCDSCSVSLTYHKGINRLVCHYCGRRVDVPYRCGNCQSTSIRTKGFGTEKIEDEVKIVFPDVRIGRMDQDTTRGKNGFDRIIKEFEEGRIDVLVGTQMISKGLDFENLTVVGILNADNLLNFPDFRAHERGYQMIEQVSGRAGRRQKRGRVVIQTSDPQNRVIRQLLNHDYIGMFSAEINERRRFNYPPFRRMIRINMRHKNMALLDQVTGQVAAELRKLFGDAVLGPEYPMVSRVQLWYIKSIILKLEPNKELARSKRQIAEILSWAEKLPGASSLRISIDVDPY
jgi:primosomal protein N' (replication factor Y)